MKEPMNPPEGLDGTEVPNLSDRDFRVMIISILNNMRKDIETIIKDPSERKNAISEINNTLEGINIRLDEAEDRISVWEDKVEKTSRQSSKRKKEFNK